MTPPALRVVEPWEAPPLPPLLDPATRQVSLPLGAAYFTSVVILRELPPELCRWCHRRPHPEKLATCDACRELRRLRKRRLQCPLPLTRAERERAAALRSARLRLAQLPGAKRISAPRKMRGWARPQSLGSSPLTMAERAELHALEDDLREEGVFDERPRKWSECQDSEGPCGWVSCRANLYLEVLANPRDPSRPPTVKLNFPGKDIDELEETCAIRVGQRLQELRETMSQEEVGQLLNLTHEWVSKIAESGIAKVREALDIEEWELRDALAVIEPR